MKQYIVDAFADELFTGNPAAVVPCKNFPSEKLMQLIASENNYSETAFVTKTAAGQYNLRWFTHGGEKIASLDGLGLILTAPSALAEYDFVSRCFYPKLNVLEDPVTGRAHTFLAPIWAEKLKKPRFKAKQLSWRGGSLLVELQGSRVLLGGKVKLFMQGDIPFDF